jgi:hypothetical protein
VYRSPERRNERNATAVSYKTALAVYWTFVQAYRDSRAIARTGADNDFILRTYCPPAERAQFSALRGK